MTRRAKTLIALAVLILVLIVGWIAAGPWMAMRGIRSALADKDVQRLERYVDFETLRGNIRGQIEDRMARDLEGRGGVFRRGATAVATMLAQRAADAMVTPGGIAVLLEGDALFKRTTGDMQPGTGAIQGGPKPMDPLKQATTHFESPGRFTATLPSQGGQPVVFVFEREGLRWKLTNIRLPRPGAGG